MICADKIEAESSREQLAYSYIRAIDRHARKLRLPVNESKIFFCIASGSLPNFLVSPAMREMDSGAMLGSVRADHQGV
jgi:hypothetical protein